jgi:hypothetical protein
MRPAELQLQLMPMQRASALGLDGRSRRGGSACARAVHDSGGCAGCGDGVSTTTLYQFEAAIPFHQLAGLRPGSASLGFHVVVHDHDDADGGRATVLSWDGRDPVSGAGAPGIGTQGGTTSLGVLHLPPPGPLVSREGGSSPLLSSDGS